MHDSLSFLLLLIPVIALGHAIYRSFAYGADTATVVRNGLVAALVLAVAQRRS
ncbi:hypothetical protein [Spongiactinospora sp. TRM90649]|uniref:hypothetical protein n=1 Tax=Spongiactinospora sp. TRM90649 TaxID=3031114 RepID=UPI0023FA2D58|nr:hypothetical protein [Spongiactinospora sp. TRM90649]MDF5755677.1 hypothetical protein [Spongiactinospora sp. TRM90649]